MNGLPCVNTRTYIKCLQRSGQYHNIIILHVYMTLGSEFSVHSHPLGTHPGGTHCAVYSFGTWTLYSPHPHVFIQLETGSVTRKFRTIIEVIRRKSWGSLPYSTAQPTYIQPVKPQPMHGCYHTQAYPIHGW